jgi:hypothetical protein
MKISLFQNITKILGIPQAFYTEEEWILRYMYMVKKVKTYFSAWEKIENLKIMQIWIFFIFNEIFMFSERATSI